MESLRKGDRIGEYRLLDKLWQGTFAESWKAESPSRGKVVYQALQNSLLIEEMRRHELPVHLITNPSVAQLLAIERVSPAFVWRFHEGRRLYKFVQELRKIKVHIAVYIARKILETLIFATSRGKVHGGIRSTRILVTPEKRIILTNFGIGFLEQRLVSQMARNLEERRKIEHILPYFPQEVLEDQLFDDVKSDIYAVGILIVEMLSGRAVPVEKIPEVLEKISVTGPLSAIIHKAVSEFGERYHHPNEMYQELTRLLKASPDVDTIYVAPPQNANRGALEAIPADSEEYRVYQAEVISAKQAIYGDVLAAEPVESDMPELGEAEEISQGLAKSRRQSVLVPTFDRKILDRLDQEPLWPNVLLSYTSASSILLTVLAVLAFLTAAEKGALAAGQIWPLLPLYAVSKSPPVLKMWFTLALTGIGGVLLLLPFVEPRGQLLRDPLARITAAVWMAFLFLLAGGGLYPVPLLYAAAVAAVIGWILPLWAMTKRATK